MANTARGGGASRASRARRARVREVSAARRRRWGRGWSSPRGAPSRWSREPSRGSLSVLVVLLLRDEVGGADGGGGDLREGAGASGVSRVCAFHARGRRGVSTVAAPRRGRGATATGSSRPRKTRKQRRRRRGGARTVERARDAPSRPRNRTRGVSCPCTTSSPRRLPCWSGVGVRSRGRGCRAGVL
jgi:hypothetical protein